MPDGFVPLIDFLGRERQGYGAPEGVVVGGYRLSGGCCMCGHCCESFVLNSIVPEERREAYLAMIAEQLPTFVFQRWDEHQMPHFGCSALGPNEGTEEMPVRRCTLQGDPGRPELCADFPDNPRTCVADECTYRWEPVGLQKPWERNHEGGGKQFTHLKDNY